MKNYVATITEHKFIPLVEVMLSTMRLTVSTPDGKDVRELEEKGSIADLSKKYDFKVEGDTYNFIGYTGRKCNIEIDNDGFFHFISMNNN